MAKDEAKKAEKKAAKKAAAAAAAAAADASTMSVDAAEPSSVVVVEDKSSKKRKAAEAVDDDQEGEIDLSTLSPIAKPLADRKMTKKLFKTIKKASKSKGHVKRGVKEVVKGLRKGEKGLVILAGDISPHDILSHLPVLCEESNVPYIFVSSKEALGSASSTKRPTSTVMIVPDGGASRAKKAKVVAEVKEEYREDFEALARECTRLNEEIVLGAGA